MIRVLHIIGGLNIGGSQSVVMNIYRNIDRNKLQFDFIVDHPKQLYFADEIRNLGGKIYFMPQFTVKNIFRIKKAWNVFFREHPEYSILHSHVRSYAALYIPIAKKYGVTTIIHSHSSSSGTGIGAWVRMVFQYPLRYQADYFFSCSDKAGRWLFGNKVVLGNRYYMLKNAIDLKRYRFSPEIREVKRRELNVEGKVVFGHVGRFSVAKNHMFLLEVFKSVHTMMPKSVLVIVGDGDLRTEIEAKIQELELEDSVVLLGNRSDINELLQAMDCFLFPSKWEGLPVTVVEAQAVGLPCMVSDTVTKDVNLSDLVIYLPINEGVEIWQKEILKCRFEKKDVSQEIINAGFDITSSSEWLTNFYYQINRK